MVTFVSQCEKNALKKTRRVLDAFANRIGDNTWQTLITEDGLLTVKKMLRQTASKSTAVSCHWIRSRSRSQFLWVVGNKLKFNEQGIVPTNIIGKQISIDESFALNTSVIALFSGIAGLFHDIGKAMALFQSKLKKSVNNEQGQSYEPYRHEWVSLRLFQAFVNERNDQQWLKELSTIDNNAEDIVLNNLISLRDGIDSNIINPFSVLPPIAKVVAWLIVSHHKLPQYPKGEDNPPNFENIDLWLTENFEACWNSPQCLKDDWHKQIVKDNWEFPYGTPLKSAHWQTQASILANKILRCDRMFIQPWFNQHYTVHVSRLALMLSDHYYSSKKETTRNWQDRNYYAYANTDKDDNDKKYLKQKLDEHNIAVGDNANKISYALPYLRSELPTLKNNKEFTRTVSKEFQNDFGWQDNAYKLAIAIKDETKEYGFFGICKASTGKGKTRGNARIMYGLSDEGECRFSVALGLRTLTLQTADALKTNLNLGSDELALLIGSQAVKELHLQANTEENNEFENKGSESAESLLKDEITLIESLPEYIGGCSEWFEHDPKILKLIQAPVLISTIDYLMPACEGIRGGRQIAPMLRLLTSDLVLDEPDDFGLEDLPALCRLVNWAGMLGSRVLLSTATISPSLSSALFSAYQAGRKHYTQVNGEHGETDKICCAWFDEFKKPHSQLITNTTDYESSHNSFVDKRIEKLKKENNPLRKALIVQLEADWSVKPSEQMSLTIGKSIKALHHAHAITVDDKKVSIGLVRMANINPLIQITKTLVSQSSPENTVIHYCVYHSQFPLMQRAYIEKQLDSALSRQDESKWLEQSNIKEVISKYTEKNHIFVVLATAVAEVGRDHDYDWAVVEPSSMRSIIQLAGRVQRHRKQEPLIENIHILSQNFRGLTNKKTWFEKPGYETKKLKYTSKSLSDLVGEHELDEINAIARIKLPEFDSSAFVKINNEEFPRVNSFNLLEHLAQQIKLRGSKSETNFAAHWWQEEATWSGEIQNAQPFRHSNTPNDDFNLIYTRSNKLLWQKKEPKTYPEKYENTDDINKKSEPLVLATNIAWWGEFDLQSEVNLLVVRLGENQEELMKKFTHLSLRRLDEESDMRWLCHSQLGVYQTLKKDEY
jgi:CRISPR-associated endonuclease/helicase Cas3